MTEVQPMWKAPRPPKAPRWGLRSMSQKRRDEQEQRKVVVAEVLRRDGRCRAFGLVPGRCSGPMDVHEIIPRSVWRAGYLVADNCVAVCRSHHDWVGDHPELAHDLGLHGWSWERRA